MRLSSPPCFAPLLATLLFAVVAARGQVVIYSLSFSPTGPSVNYNAIESGYVVVDTDSGSFSSVLILRDPANFKRYFTTSLLTGSYFDLLEEGSGDIYGVLTSGGSSGSGASLETLSLQALGKASSTSLGGGARLRVPRKLSGFLLANSQEAVTPNSGGGQTIEYGFAGSSRVRGKLDQASTRDANDARLTAAATVTAITETLQRRGIPPEATPTPTPTPSPTPSP